MSLLANTSSNVLRLSFLDILDVLSFLLHMLINNVWMLGTLHVLGALGMPLPSIFFYEQQATIWDCLVTINSVYSLDRSSSGLAGFGLWEEARVSRSFELRISKHLDIGVGWEVDCAHWVRKQFLRAGRFVENHIILHLHCYTSAPLALRDAFVAVYYMVLGLYPDIAYRIWRDIIALRWGQIAVDLCLASLSIYWTRICIDDRSPRSNSRWSKFRLRATNALYVVMSGSELNVERLENDQAITEKALLGEYCRIEIFRSCTINRIFASTGGFGKLCKALAVPDSTGSMLCSLMERIISEELSYKGLVSSRNEKAQVAIDAMQKVVDGRDTPIDLKDTLHYAMMRLCTTTGVLPQRFLLRGVRLRGGEYVASGGFGEIWKGVYGNIAVCVKIPKFTEKMNYNQKIRDLAKEAILWSRLNHPNVLPFYGIYCVKTLPERLCLVSPWEENGNVSEYLGNNTNAPRLPLISEVIDGLHYLHENKVIHGDLKGANILVSSTGVIRLADFGLSSILDTSAPSWRSMPTMTHVGGTVRWMAPELFDEPCNGLYPTPTFSSDIYSLGSVMYEILTCLVPFYEVKNEWNVMLRITHGKPPAKPLFKGLELTDRIWAIMERCWDLSPRKRPNLWEVRGALWEVAPMLCVAGRASNVSSASAKGLQGDTSKDPLERRLVTESMHESLMIHEYIFTQVEQFIREDPQDSTFADE